MYKAFLRAHDLWKALNYVAILLLLTIRRRLYRPHSLGPPEPCWKVSPLLHQERSSCTPSLSQQGKEAACLLPQVPNPLLPFFSQKQKVQCLQFPLHWPLSSMNLGLKCLRGQPLSPDTYFVFNPLSLQTLPLWSLRTLHKMPGTGEADGHPADH